MNATQQTMGQNCECGCAECPDLTCGLDCLVAPRFFCGQLLTDADLTAMVEWTRNKFRLARYRHGWGISCGLEVRRDGDRPTGVVVKPGYAIDCCGRDVVICQDYHYDLTAACRQASCENPSAVQKAPARTDSGEGGGGREGYDPAAEQGLEDDFAGAIALDLYLEYAEEQTDPQAVLSNRSCGQGAACEYSRTQEKGRLRWVQAPAQAPKKSREEWQDAYKDRDGEIDGLIKQVKGDVDAGRSARRHLLDWIHDHPLEQFAFVEARIQDAGLDALKTEGEVVPLLFWLILDFRLQNAESACPACPKESGVPLARVWLSPGQAAGKRCSILSIENRAPHRRMLQKDECHPVAGDCVELASYLWMPSGDVETALSTTGLRIRSEYITPRSWSNLERLKECGETAACGAADVCVLVYHSDHWGERVVGFCTGICKDVT